MTQLGWGLVAVAVAAVIDRWHALLGWGLLAVAGATAGRSRGGPGLRLGVIVTHRLAGALLAVGLVAA